MYICHLSQRLLQKPNFLVTPDFCRIGQNLWCAAPAQNSPNIVTWRGRNTESDFNVTVATPCRTLRKGTVKHHSNYIDRKACKIPIYISHSFQHSSSVLQRCTCSAKPVLRFGTAQPLVLMGRWQSIKDTATMYFRNLQTTSDFLSTLSCHKKGWTHLLGVFEVRESRYDVYFTHFIAYSSWITPGYCRTVSMIIFVFLDGSGRYLVRL